MWKVFDLGTDWPERDEDLTDLERIAKKVCPDDAFRAWSGLPAPEETPLGDKQAPVNVVADFSYPSPADWRAGARWIRCDARTRPDETTEDRTAPWRGTIPAVMADPATRPQLTAECWDRPITPDVPPVKVQPGERPVTTVPPTLPPAGRAGHQPEGVMPGAPLQRGRLALREAGVDVRRGEGFARGREVPGELPVRRRGLPRAGPLVAGGRRRGGGDPLDHGRDAGDHVRDRLHPGRCPDAA